MSTFLIFYLLSTLAAVIGLVGIEAWERRHDPHYKPMTLLNLFQGAALSLIPFINTLTAAAMLVYFVGKIAPRIVLFEKKQ